jgi:hypothetical protein
MATPAAAPVPPRPDQRPTRLAQALARRRNPLRRRSDILRAWLHDLLVLGLVGVTALAALLGVAYYRGDRAAAARLETRVHQVQAVALADASTGSAAAAVSGTGAAVAVSWTSTTGVRRTATVAAPRSVTRGRHLSVWINAQGGLAAAPISAGTSASDAIYLAVLVWICAGGALIGGTALVRLRLERADLCRWEQGWATTEPVWTHRR